MTRSVWKALKVSEAVSKTGGRVTLSGLADLVRGLGGGAFAVISQSNKKGSSSETRGSIDLDTICGGKLALSKEVRPGLGSTWLAIHCCPSAHILLLADRNFVAGSAVERIPSRGFSCKCL